MREVVRRDPDADPHRMADALGIDAWGDVGQRVARHQARQPGGELDHLHPAVHLGPRLGERLAVLAGEQRDEVVEALVHQGPQAEHDPGPLDHGRLGPGGQGGVGGPDDPVHHVGAAERGAGDHLAGRGVIDVLVAVDLGDSHVPPQSRGTASLAVAGIDSPCWEKE